VEVAATPTDEEGKAVAVAEVVVEVVVEPAVRERRL
jgi:hypothetical protein